MSTIKLTVEEFNAMEDFCENHYDSFENRVTAFVKWSASWENTYLPIKHMGMEKFVKCLLNGYKLDEPEFNFGNLNVSLNSELQYIQKNPNSKDPIYINIGDNCYNGISVEEAEFLIESLQKTVKFLKDNVNNIGGR